MKYYIEISPGRRYYANEFSSDSEFLGFAKYWGEEVRYEYETQNINVRLVTELPLKYYIIPYA